MRSQARSSILTSDAIRIGRMPAQAHWNGLLRGLVVLAILSAALLASHGQAAFHL